MVNGKTVFMD